MSDDKKTFTVSDRRHFTREGEVRTEVPGRESPSPAPSPAEPARAGAVAAPEAAGPARWQADLPWPAGDDADAGGIPLDFIGLLLSLGAQASVLLGHSPPGQRPAAPDLGGARAIISLLEVLEDKTEGRRTPEEDEVLEGLLYELRLDYVTQTRKGGP